jgi:hypothetical protein
VAIHLPEALIEPTLDRSSVDVGRKAERRRAGRTASNAIGIDRHLPGIEVAAAFALGDPQVIEEHARAGERLRLPRLDLGA